MIWFGKSFIKFCKSFINLIKLVSTRTCSLARVRTEGNKKETTSDGLTFKSPTKQSVESPEIVSKSGPEVMSTHLSFTRTAFP